MRKWIKRIAIWGVIVVSLLAIAWVAVLMTGRQRLDDELAYWREQGMEIPIDAGFNIKTDETGDPRILRVIELYKDVPESTLELIDKPDDADPDALAQAVAECDQILVLIHEIAAQEQAVWRGEVLDSKLWLDDLVARLNHPRSIARLLDAQALSRARAGDLEGACESIVAGLSIARQVGEHPAMIAVLVEVVIIETMLDRLASIYSQGGMPTKPVINALEQFDMGAIFSETIRWEGAYMTRVTTGHALSPWLMHDVAYSLRQYRGLVQQTWVPVFYLRKINIDDVHPWWVMQYKIAVPALHAFQLQLLRVERRLAAIRLGVILRQYKEEQGSYPDRLEELKVTAVDPMSGRKFEYVTEDAGFILFTDVPGYKSKEIQLEWE